LNSWPGAAEQLNNWARVDRSLGAKLAELSEDQSHQNKLAWALESGRTYGMRQQKCQMLQKRQLNKEFAHPAVEAMW
jgi:hypothetical protein